MIDVAEKEDSLGTTYGKIMLEELERRSDLTLLRY
jgi:hypothetical protein